MDDRREELLYRKVNQLAAFFVAACAIGALLIGVVSILLQGQIKRGQQSAAELELRLGQLERRLDQQARVQAEPASPVKPLRPSSRYRGRDRRSSSDHPAAKQQPPAAPAQSASPNLTLLNQFKSLEVDDARASAVLEQLAGETQSVSGMNLQDLVKATQVKAAQGDLPETLTWGRRALAIDPNQTTVLLLVAEASLGLDRIAEAEAFIARAAEQSHLSGRAQLLRGRIALRDGRDRRARQAFQKAKDVPAVAADAALLLAEMAVADGDLDAAQSELDYCEAVEADRPDALQLRAEILFELRQFDEFVNTVSRLIQIAGADHRLRVLLGRALIQLGRPSPALAELQGVLEQDPTNAVAWHWLGVARIKQLQPAQAIEHLTRSIELESSSAMVWHHMGVAWANRDDCAAALEAFDLALAIDADLADAHFGRAVCLARTGQASQARTAADRAVELDPELANALGRVAGLGKPRGSTPAPSKPARGA